MELNNLRRAFYSFGTLCLFCLVAFSTLAEDALDQWHFRDSLQLNRVRFVGGIFIGLGANGRLATSEDGRTWVLRNTGTSASLRGVAHGKVLAVPSDPDTLFIAVGNGATILKSSDGTNWTRVVTTNTCDLEDVAWKSPNTFAAIATRAFTNQPNVLNSKDGNNWDPLCFESGYPSYEGGYYGDTIVAADGIFIASAGWQFAHDIWRSTNGSTWQYVGFANQDVGGIAYGSNRFLLVGWEGWPRTSTDLGLSWSAVGDTNVCNPGPSWPCMAGNDVAFGNGTFVIVRSGVRDGLLTTTDCVTWVNRSGLKALTSSSSIAFGKGTFVAVGPDGVFQSEPVATPILTASRVADPNALRLQISGELGRSYRLQTSTLSSAWTDRWLYTNTTGSVTFVDPVTPESSQLFYRVVSP